MKKRIILCLLALLFCGASALSAPPMLPDGLKIICEEALCGASSLELSHERFGKVLQNGRRPDNPGHYRQRGGSLAGRGPRTAAAWKADGKIPYPRRCHLLTKR